MALAAIFLGLASDTLCRTGERLGDVERGLGERLGDVERGFLVPAIFQEFTPATRPGASCRTTVCKDEVSPIAQIRYVESLD